MAFNRRSFFKGSGAAIVAGAAPLPSDSVSGKDAPEPPNPYHNLQHRKHLLQRHHRTLLLYEEYPLNSSELFLDRIPETSPYASFKSMAPHRRLDAYRKNQKRLEKQRLEDRISLLEKMESWPEQMVSDMLDYIG